MNHIFKIAFERNSIFRGEHEIFEKLILGIIPLM